MIYSCRIIPELAVLTSPVIQYYYVVARAWLGGILSHGQIGVGVRSIRASDPSILFTWLLT